jgi:lysozyme
MMDTEKLLNALLLHEGLKLKPYADPIRPHILTIGIGRNLTDDGISAAEARLLCINDIVGVARTLDARVPWWRGLTDGRQNVLAEMCFNLGWGTLATFHHFLACLEHGDCAGAAREMLASRWATQVGQRAAALAHAMRTGAD